MKGKRLAAWLTVLVLVLQLPLSAAAVQTPELSAANDSPNNLVQPVEEWVYTPNASQSAGTVSVMSATASEESSADIVEVSITATDATTGETVSVGGAEVNLYVGAEWRSTTKDTDGDGKVEVSLAELSAAERRNATLSASKVVSRGKAINGTGRDALFGSFPKDEESGEYYRYTMELHSETIDTAGNWLGAEIPEATESDKVDIVFIIDATGSMSDEINNVKNNIASFSENLIESGLDIRFSIIDYRDITLSGEDTNVHTVSGSRWMTDIDSVVNSLASITATGGGDGPETVLDPLGIVADNSQMNWRSDAYRFAFVLTDANYKTDNNYGYSSLQQVADKLAEMKVVTSVITSSSYQSTYSGLYTTTGGIYANIDSSTFDEEMMALSDSIIESVTRKMTLHLKEPRMLVNLAVCYFADDGTSQAESYENNVRTMLNTYAKKLAEATDAHIMIDNILLFSTDNRLDFYDTDEIASMADIQIQSEVKDDGKWWSNVEIHNNAYVFGFFTQEEILTNSSYMDAFKNLKDADTYLNRTTYERILSGGVDVNGFSMIDNVEKFAATQVHETGHYLLGFRDEYQRGDGATWSSAGGKPYSGNFGLMDNQYNDIEISRSNDEYSYMGNNYEGTDVLLHTEHSWTRKGSCEDTLAAWMTNESYVDVYGKIDDPLCDFTVGSYTATYSKVTGTSDHRAKYPYAALSDSDFLTPAGTTSASGSAGLGVMSSAARVDYTDAVATNETVAAVTFTAGADAVTIRADSACTVGLLKAGDEAFTAVTLTDGVGSLSVAGGELAEVRVSAEVDGTVSYNTYYIDRSGETDAGYFYTSADNTVMAYVTTDTAESYTFVADNTGYTNGSYRSVNQATRISSDGGSGFDSGEIYSVASYLADIDYSTLSWFHYADGVWTALATDYSEEESMNIGARADLTGEGLYVLMAKAAPTEGAQAARNLRYIQSTEVDAWVTLCFDDPNTGSKYYNVYYSDAKFSDKHADGVVVRSFPADSTELTIDLLERGRSVYAAVEIVLEDGSRSELSDIILVGGEADSDGDGIPDWYCDKYLLWGEDGEEKDIANSDDDGDGLTNLEEYLGGSDPTDPNDPVHTTNIPVESVSLSQNTVDLIVGETAVVTATVLPENASNRAVKWSVSDSSVVSVAAEGSQCSITALALGEAQVYAVTEDGGYSAVVSVSVSDYPSGTCGDLTWKLDGEGVLTISGTGDMPDYTSSLLVPWKAYRSSIRQVRISEGVTGIGQFAFYLCRNLQSVTAADTVKRIGGYAFYGCSALNTLSLPEGMERIGDGAFSNCGAITGFTVPGGVRSVGAYAWRSCTALTEIVFQSSAPAFGIRAFEGVTATAVYPADDSSWTEAVRQQYGGTITWSAVGGAAEIASGYSGSTTWSLTDDGTITFRGEGAMKNYGSKSAMPWYDYSEQIEAVVIAEGVTSIGDYAFYGMGLESIEIASTVTSIGTYAFKGAENLTGVVLPEGLTQLGESAFYGCTALTAIEIPASVWTIKPYTFKNCTALAELVLHEGNLMKISDSAFYNTALTELVLPDCLSTLDVYSFKNCSKLASITIGAGLTQIREAAFYGTAISTIEIPEGITKIGSYAFKNCKNLGSVVLPETLTTVGEASFYGCTALKTLELPDAVTTIDSFAFRKCVALEAVQFCSGLEEIGESSFYGCTALTEITVPDSVTTIKGYAFKGCEGLVSVTLGDGLTAIGESAFHTCINLPAIAIPASVGSIGAYCFSGSYNLRQISFAGDAPAIGSGAFKGMTANACYPSGNTTWTASVMQNYGGSITWTAG